MTQRLVPGKYRVSVRSAQLTESQKGTLGILFWFQCEEGEIDCTRWVTEHTSEYVLKDLETLGYSKELLADIANLDRIAEITRGRECEIVVEEKEYLGNIEAKVRWINPIVHKASVGAKERMYLMLTGQPVPLVSQPRKQEIPPSVPTDDSEVPF